MKVFRFIVISALLANMLGLLGCCNSEKGQFAKTPVDYVNPYIGNISHMLVPTFPTVHLPNSMLRVIPLRDDFTGNFIKGLPVFLVGHRTFQAFSISPYQGDLMKNTYDIRYEYDNEVIKPYYYEVYLDNVDANIQFAPSHQAAIYNIDFGGTEIPRLVVNAKGGELTCNGNVVSGYQQIDDTKTKAYLYLEVESAPESIEVMPTESVVDEFYPEKGAVMNHGIILSFAKEQRKLKIRYGVSFISEEQAKKNLYREIEDYDLQKIAKKGEDVWNEALGKFTVKGEENDKVVFYTSLYRFYERMVCISEDGKYYSGYDNQVHEDNGIPFYVDDWLWDTYLAAHPLRIIIEPEKEGHMLNSFIRMAEQMDNFWMPTFSEVIGDTRRMFANHGILTMLDGYEKGVKGFDLEKAYLAGKNAVTEKTLAPWSGMPAGKLDEFYKQNGYFPALSTEIKTITEKTTETSVITTTTTIREIEKNPEVHSWERRQPVAVTLGTVYDEWGLAQLARHLGKEDDYNYFLERSLNYKKLFNEETKFFHPKDANGNFVQPFDYRYTGGLGGRDAYDENNGWIYRWYVQHNIANLIELNGGKEGFVAELERMYNTPLGKIKFEFYAIYPDHTGNVGQFSMANEPSMHIPYLYSYAGEPWRTQKRVRSLLDQWFRNDLMGMPGDEDGGGLSTFVVFSYLGFYPVTPGLPMYVIGSPVFEQAAIQLPDNKTFEVICENYSPQHKYIQSAKLNGKEWNKSWFSHEELMQGGKLELVMGKYPNKKWAASDDAVPPSFSMK